MPAIGPSSLMVGGRSAIEMARVAWRGFEECSAVAAALANPKMLDCFPVDLDAQTGTLRDRDVTVHLRGHANPVGVGERAKVRAHLVG